MIDRVVLTVALGALVVGALFTMFYAMVSPLGVAFDGQDPEVVRRQIVVAILMVLVYLAGIWSLQRRKRWAHWLAGAPFLGWAAYFALESFEKGWTKAGFILFALNVCVCLLLAWRRERILPAPKP